MLDFSYNNLTCIENIEIFANTLIILNLSDNRINFTLANISINSFNHLENLIQLNLSKNVIDSLKYSYIDKLLKLEELDLSYS